MSGSPTSTVQPAPDNSAADLSLSTNTPSNLVTACYTSLTTAPLDHAKLEQLPQHVLVQLLAQAAADRDQVKAAAQQQEQELARLAKEKKLQYIINPPLFQDRVGEDMYNRVEAVTAKWKPRLQLSDFNAEWSVSNYRGRQMLYNTHSKTISLKPWGSFGQSDTDIHAVMSSALLQYRLCCLFEDLHIYVEGPAGYKNVWSAEVQHVPTGEAVGFSEWKGAATIRVSKLEGPKLFEDDMLELLNLIYDERCPHPYDGTVAGSVA